MSISYNKTTKVVLLVQEGSDIPREATEEDLVKAGFVSANNTFSEDADYAGNSEELDDCPECKECNYFCEARAFDSRSNDNPLEDFSLEAVLLDSFREAGGLLKDAGKFVKREGFDRVRNALTPEENKEEENFFDLFGLGKKKPTSLFDVVSSHLKAKAIHETLNQVIEEVNKVWAEAKPEATKKESPEVKVKTEPVEKEATQEATSESEFSKAEQEILKQAAKVGLGAQTEEFLRKVRDYSDAMKSKTKDEGGVSCCDFEKPASIIIDVTESQNPLKDILKMFPTAKLFDFGDTLHKNGILDPFFGMDEKIKSRIDGLNFEEEFLASGQTWTDADADGNLVARGGETEKSFNISEELAKAEELKAKKEAEAKAEKLAKEAASAEEAAKEEEAPEFNATEQAVIDKLAELGQGEQAKDAMRKAREFTDFLSSKKPTPEEAQAFAKLLKSGMKGTWDRRNKE